MGFAYGHEGIVYHNFLRTQPRTSTEDNPHDHTSDAPDGIYLDLRAFAGQAPAASQGRIPDGPPGSTSRFCLRTRGLACTGIYLGFEIPGRGMDRLFPQRIRWQSP